MATSPVQDMQMLVAFAKAGVQMLATRILSLLGLIGLVLLAWYVAANPTWHGVVVVGMVGLCFCAVVRAESGPRQAAPPQ